nr:ATP-dependent sacrificial sulfur transferase LarE [Actinomycetales bacterium]
MVPPDGQTYGPGRRLGVSFSGGVDSAVVAALAVRAFGPEAVVALIAVSASLARRELRAARETAAEIGVELAEVATFETDVEDYRENRADRCYFCRTEMFTQFTGDTARQLGLAAIAYGENATDTDRIDRPGAVAALEFGVLRPLSVAGIGKAEVRELAREYGLSVADKPASPCLASRVPHGTPVTPELLRQIDDAEDAVIEAGFTEARVRHHGDIARIEVPVADVARLAERGVRDAIVRGVLAAGYRYATLDLAGLQSGAFTLTVIGRRND